MSDAAAADGQQPEDFKKDATGAASRWKVELAAAKKKLADWHTSGDTVDDAFLGYREGNLDGAKPSSRYLSLFNANVSIQLAMLYGNTPKADVSRRFADSEDDVARVAGEIAERLLHTDIEKASDTAAEAFGEALKDWLLPGGGFVRVRYDMEEEKVPATPAVVRNGSEVPNSAVAESMRLTKEDALIDYVPWKDVLWSPCRVWGELTWLGFAADMAKAPFVKRFKDGDEVWKKVPKQSNAEKDEEKAVDPWARVRVWELWHKDERKVYFYVEGHSEVLDVLDDPLGLDGFWPCPKPLFATLSTSKLVPRPDYALAQDLYKAINARATRIAKLEEAVKVAGTYDKDSPELARILTEACQNEMLPSEGWGAFLEKGGLQGSMQFLPIDLFVNAIGVLQAQQQSDIEMLYQVTGQSDIMRGQASSAGSTAHEQSIKAKFGSVRVQRKQDEFARFVSEAQALKLEIVCKHFQPQTIVERSNALYAFKHEQPGVVEKAVQLLKSDYSCYRVQVKPESVALQDFAALKEDRTEVLGALSTYLQAAAPMVERMPTSLPFLLKLLQSALAGLKGSAAMEGIIDGAITAAEAEAEKKAANPQQAPPDPKVQAEQMKLQGTQMKIAADVQKQQMKHQQDLEKINAETVAADQQEQSQARWNVAEATQKQIASNALKPPEAPKPGGFP